MANTKIPAELSSTPSISDSGNATAITITSDENVGIGTSSPTSYGNSQKILVIEDSTSPAIAWSDTGQTRDWFGVAQGSGLYFNYGDGGGSGSASNVTSVLVLDNSGKVGIGTASPTGTLHVVNAAGGTTRANYMSVEGSTADNNNYPGIEMKGGTLADNFPYYGITNGGLGTWIQAGYHSSNYNNRAAITVNNGTIGLYTGSGGDTYNERWNIDSRGLLKGASTNNIARIQATNYLTLADDSSVDLMLGTAGAGLLYVYEAGGGSGALVWLSYGDSSGGNFLKSGGAYNWSSSDTDGQICVIKSASSHTATLKNRVGISRNFAVTIIAGAFGTN